MTSVRQPLRWAPCTGENSIMSSTRRLLGPGPNIATNAPTTNPSSRLLAIERVEPNAQPWDVPQDTSRGRKGWRSLGPGGGESGAIR